MVPLNNYKTCISSTYLIFTASRFLPLYNIPDTHLMHMRPTKNNNKIKKKRLFIFMVEPTTILSNLIPDNLLPAYLSTLPE